MKNAPCRLADLVALFRNNLENLYDQQEITAFVFMLADYYLGWNKTQCRLRLEDDIPREQTNLFLQALSELKTFKPIQYIMGVAYFNDLVLEVNPSVLIPRPETEELCSIVRNENNHMRFQEFTILDIGTGSGCIAIDLKRSFPLATVKAIDVSRGAVEIARRNAEKYNCRISFEEADIFDPFFNRKDERFDLIISNPPYVTEGEKARMQSNVLDYEPGTALFVPNTDPLRFYRKIADFAWKRLTRPGMLYFEINERYGNEMSALLKQKGFDKVTVLKDIRDNDRFISAEARTLLDDTSYWYADKPE